MLLGGVEGGADGRADRGLRPGRAPRGPGRAARARGRADGCMFIYPPGLAAAVPAARAAALHGVRRRVAGVDRRGLRPRPPRAAAGMGGGHALPRLSGGLPERVVRPERLPQRGPARGGRDPDGEAAGPRRSLPRLPRLQAAARAGPASGSRGGGPVARLPGRLRHGAGLRRRGDGGFRRRDLAGLPDQRRARGGVDRGHARARLLRHGERLRGGEDAEWRPARLGLRRASGGRGRRLRARWFRRSGEGWAAGPRSR